MKCFRFLGKRGRTTIPFELRLKLGFAAGDVISFEECDGNVILRHEKVCDKCIEANRAELLSEIFESLSKEEIRNVLLFLSVKLAAVSN